ncbi:putative receptor-like protein kinase [Carex littledalei]|uniref:Putative receptor-like protein kinase n=1 Tax=Carex littledalei TaxID=544730 RepID=A0A833RSD5_9POAL|nr:putative receptor-like protein kinase [Carex littledalei]
MKFFELEYCFVINKSCTYTNQVMVTSCRRSDEVVDPNIETKPSTRALERELLTALRCVDADADKRPKMCQVVRMLDADDVSWSCYAWMSSLPGLHVLVLLPLCNDSGLNSQIYNQGSILYDKLLLILLVAKLPYTGKTGPH